MLLNTRQPMNSSRCKLRGVLPVFQTPYHADETIDLATLEKEVAWLYDCGAGGIGRGRLQVRMLPWRGGHQRRRRIVQGGGALREARRDGRSGRGDGHPA